MAFNSGNSQFDVPMMKYGARGTHAYVRWVPSSDDTQTLSEAHGVSSVTRTSTGLYVINFASKSKAVVPIGKGYTANGTTVQHFVRVESHSASAATATVSHKIVTFATAATLVNVSTLMTDVSAASGATSVAYAQAPCAGTVTKIYGTLGSAITGSDSTVTTSIAGTPITGGSMTIAVSGSAGGSKFSATPSAANTVAAGDLLTATTDGASSTTAALNVQFEIQSTAGTPVVSDTVDEMWFAFFLRMYN